jgi:hypothetical protein
VSVFQSCESIRSADSLSLCLREGHLKILKREFSLPFFSCGSFFVGAIIALVGKIIAGNNHHRHPGGMPRWRSDYGPQDFRLPFPVAL